MVELELAQRSSIALLHKMLVLVEDTTATKIADDGLKSNYRVRTGVKLVLRREVNYWLTDSCSRRNCWERTCNSRLKRMLPSWK
jgi:hypothetical protein